MDANKPPIVYLTVSIPSDEQVKAAMEDKHEFMETMIAKLSKGLDISESMLMTDMPQQYSLARHLPILADFERVQMLRAHQRTASQLWYNFLKTTGRVFNTRRVQADLMRKHRKWPLGQRVATLTPQGYLIGRIHKHDRSYGARCAVDFEPMPVDMDNTNGARFCHTVPFRNLKKV